MTMTFKSRGKYKGYQIDSHDEILKKTDNLSLAEIKSLWSEYDHQFRNPASLVLKMGAWIHLQVFTYVLMDKCAWDFTNHRPKPIGYCSGKGNPKNDPDAYMREDYYTNPEYGWCRE